jgi:hypothetical protein
MSALGHKRCGFQVEHEQVARRLFDWKVGGFCALENTVSPVSINVSFRE